MRILSFYPFISLNKYATSKVVGFDAVYVHLVDEYYSKGSCPWLDIVHQLAKIQFSFSQAYPDWQDSSEPTKVTAVPWPKSALSLRCTKSPYTISSSGDPECSHCGSCQLSWSFYDKWKSKGVEVLGHLYLNNSTDKVPNCWKYLDETGNSSGWINAALDPEHHQSKYVKLYTMWTSTPRV